MKWFLRSCFLLVFAALPLTVQAAPLPPSPPPPPPLKPCATCAVKAPEFDLPTVSSGMAVFVGAGWMLLRRRRNRRG
jgi:hypothetical protein